LRAGTDIFGVYPTHLAGCAAAKPTGIDGAQFVCHYSLPSASDWKIDREVKLSADPRSHLHGLNMAISHPPTIEGPNVGGPKFDTSLLAP
jgi:hypothetical protein